MSKILPEEIAAAVVLKLGIGFDSMEIDPRPGKTFRDTGRVHTIRIVTQRSRDPARRNNGGEYDFWLSIREREGQIVVKTSCSCDFWQPETEWRTVEWNSTFPALVERLKRESRRMSSDQTDLA